MCCFKVKGLLFLFVLMSTLNIYALTPNQILSRGKPVFTSSGNASGLVDNKFGSGSAWKVTNNSWIAIKLQSGPTQVFVNWNEPVYAWSNLLSPSGCPNSNLMPIDYDIMTSANSTNGADGLWTSAIKITGNIVTARGHKIDFTGMSWVKMVIKNGGGSIDEIEVYDATHGLEDVWFFPGTSISANTYKSNPPPALNFADLVSQAHAGFTPAMIRGGIACISTNDMVKNLSSYSKMAGNAHFWAIEQGTNDAWGGSNSNVARLTKNLQIIIDSCKAYGIEPIIARLLATNKTATSSNWQVHQDYEKAIDSLTKKNKLIPGPDLYGWFLAHPSELNSDGVHPNATGDASIQRLWAQKVDSLYKVKTNISGTETTFAHDAKRDCFIAIDHGALRIDAKANGEFGLFDVQGKLLFAKHFASAGSCMVYPKAGVVLGKFTNKKDGSQSTQLIIR